MTEQSNLLFVKHFASLKVNPKWGVKLIIATIIISLSKILISLATDYKKLYEEAGLSGQQLEQTTKYAELGGT